MSHCVEDMSLTIFYSSCSHLSFKIQKIWLPWLVHLATLLWQQAAGSKASQLHALPEDLLQVMDIYNLVTLSKAFPTLHEPSPISWGVWSPSLRRKSQPNWERHSPSDPRLGIWDYDVRHQVFIRIYPTDFTPASSSLWVRLRQFFFLLWVSSLSWTLDWFGDVWPKV